MVVDFESNTLRAGRSSLALGDLAVGSAIVEEPDSTALLAGGDRPQVLAVPADRTPSIDVAREET
jgi:hypothetical protein